MELKRYTQTEFNEVRRLHELYLFGEPGGVWADLRNADLSDLDLRHSNLSRADLSGSDLSHTDLRDAALRVTDLSHADLRGANLSGADLLYANLSGANLRDVVGLPTAPVVPDLDKRILAAIESGEYQLNMREWHYCRTTHCRSGFAIHFAGEAGYELEKRVGPSCAGALIYFASCGYVPDFYTTDEDALADIRERAGR